jgi:hypothetical protein
MSYRDDHEAALRRIADLEQRLEAERAAHAADEGRVAELEKELAALRRAVPATPKEEKPRPEKPKRKKPAAQKPGPRRGWVAALPIVPFVAGFSLVVFFVGRGCIRASYDGSQWLAVATDKARSWAPDAELMRVEGTLIDPRGRADAAYNGRWHFSFRSQSRAALPRPADPPPPVPGAPPPRAPPWPGCQYTCDVSHWRKGGWQINCDESRPSADCGSSLAAPVRCTVKQVWQRARERGAPDPALANLKLSAAGGSWLWQLTVLDRAAERQAPLFATALADDCSDGSAAGAHDKLAPK